MNERLGVVMVGVCGAGVEENEEEVVVRGLGKAIWIFGSGVEDTGRLEVGHLDELDEAASGVGEREGGLDAHAKGSVVSGIIDNVASDELTAFNNLGFLTEENDVVNPEGGVASVILLTCMLSGCLDNEDLKYSEV